MKEKIDRLIKVEENSIQLLRTKKAPHGAIQHHEFIIAYLKALEIIFDKEIDIYQLKRYLFRRESSYHLVLYFEKYLTAEEIKTLKEAFL